MDCTRRPQEAATEAMSQELCFPSSSALCRWMNLGTWPFVTPSVHWGANGLPLPALRLCGSEGSSELCQPVTPSPRDSREELESVLRATSWHSPSPQGPPGTGLQASPNLAFDFHPQGGKGSSQSQGAPPAPPPHRPLPGPRDLCPVAGGAGSPREGTPRVGQTKHGRGRGSSNEGKGKLVPSWEIPERHGSFQRAGIPKMRKRGESLMVALHQQQRPPCPTDR